MIEYIVGALVASLLGFLFFFNVHDKRRSDSGEEELGFDQIRDECVKSAANGECGSDKMSAVDVIVVGAGVAGSALAYTLGKIETCGAWSVGFTDLGICDFLDVLIRKPIPSEVLDFSPDKLLCWMCPEIQFDPYMLSGLQSGRRVHVIERDLSEPDRIVGELLQPGGYLKLIELGLEDCVDEIDAQRVVGYALFKDGKSAKLSYPLEKFHSDVSGRSFHNGRFIQRMREKAGSLPNVSLEQGSVTSLLDDNGTIKGVVYKTKTGEELKAYAPLTIVCDGCFSNLRRSLCKPQVEVPSCFVGLVLENCNLPFPNHGHVILGDPSPILFYPISSTEVRCLVDVPGQRVPSVANGELAKYLKTVVAPQVPPEIYDSFVAAVDSGNIRTMPNRSMPASPYPTPGALLMGDAFNMRHPLTGGGMTVALSDIVVLNNLLKPLRDLNDASSLCSYLESFYTLRKPVASTINTLAGPCTRCFLLHLI
ncbi:hypothetical protein Scep_001252 [Stephania cephalantha]|uniref:Squalene monooxygenase n=1 Tax=Stephania cephalantha TaxID=152367 RepID=A0AAP0Q7J1_9MAGN